MNEDEKQEVLDRVSDSYCIQEYLKLQESKNNIILRQFQIIHKHPHFQDFVQNIIDRYNSLDYIDRWYEKGIDPPRPLYFTLFRYAKMYGRTCTDLEYQECGGKNVKEIYYCNGYYFGITQNQEFFILKSLEMSK